ncbi:hypothetical protein [Oligosphaera ethanolica]|uniref:Uncharacterized protein n=1 Tax=Oligosphaera ethanolica TaxID=760260 RepID=A0AAE3VGG5_9BACT|nr:hypothetical protein [Oligosphaera ethanolica]MDQ0289821.1 hypothetical protein [Oligosphaera ethanolica]
MPLRGNPRRRVIFAHAKPRSREKLLFLSTDYADYADFGGVLAAGRQDTPPAIFAHAKPRSREEDKGTGKVNGGKPPFTLPS